MRPDHGVPGNWRTTESLQSNYRVLVGPVGCKESERFDGPDEADAPDEASGRDFWVVSGGPHQL